MRVYRVERFIGDLKRRKMRRHGPASDKIRASCTSTMTWSA
jgi:hypothetical protein